MGHGTTLAAVAHQRYDDPTGEVVWTIVVAGGSGTRFGGPKQYEPLGDRRVLDWAVYTARSASAGVVVVVPDVVGCNKL